MSISDNNGTARHRIKVLGKAVATPVEGTWVVMEPADVGKRYAVRCPRCKSPIVLFPDKEGVRRATCRKCGAIVAFNAVGGTVPADAANQQQQAQRSVAQQAPAQQLSTVMSDVDTVAGIGRLEWRRLLFTRHHNLAVGEITLGRQDSSAPSDLMWNDKKMSARSVKLTVEQGERGFTYRLTVLRATNPVLVNGRREAVGNTIFLRLGDVITMGNTRIVLKPI